MNNVSQVSVDYPFGILYFRKCFNVCTVSSWAIGVTAQSRYWYEYDNLIPNDYKPVTDIRILSYDNGGASPEDIVAIINLMTNRQVRVYLIGSTRRAYVFITATYLIK